MRPLASGGMGQIWVAHDEQLRRPVALKLMHQDEGTSGDKLVRFEQEARTIARLQHPHVVQVFDYGITGEDTPYIVMELLEGEDLARNLRRGGAMPLRSVVPLVVQAAKGLHAAHRAGIIHRDLKPANLFLVRHSGDQLLKILDFGVAAVRQPGDTGGESSAMVGTPSYMSPEQASRGRVDHRADLWSLAVVAYEALTGRPPFFDDTLPGIANLICHEPHEPPSAHVDSLVPAVDGFFQRALAKDPAERFPSALHLAGAFCELVSTQEQRLARILVVDDEVDLEDLMRQKFRRKLKRREYELLFAHGGEEALEVIGRSPDLDVVLTDLNMPGMGGLELLERLHRAGPALRAVVISAYGDMTNIRAAMNAGAYDFITKPVDFADLETTLEKAIRDARELRRALRSFEENDALRLFVDDALVDRLLPVLRLSSEVSAETIDATVVSIDVCDSRRREKHDTVAHLFEVLNRYFDQIVPVINKSHGSVVRFIGDAALAVFQGDGHLHRACEACFQVRRLLSEMAFDRGDGSEGSGVCMGLDSGAVFSGSIGSRRIKRLDYSVLGPVVSRALELEQLAERGQLLVCDDTVQRLETAFVCRRIDPRLEDGRAVYNVERSNGYEPADQAATRPDELTPTLYVQPSEHTD